MLKLRVARGRRRREYMPISGVDREEHAAGYRVWPKRASMFLVGPRGLHLETRFLWACHAHDQAEFRLPWPRNLFNNGLRRWISLGIVRPHRKAATAELPKKLAHRALVPVQPEILLQPIAQIGSPPPDNLVRAGLRTRLDQRCDRLPWFGGKLRRTARRLPVLQTRKALRIIPVDPIAQRLAIHSAAARRRGPIGAFHHQRQCQHPPRRRRAPHSSRCMTQLRSRQILPGDFNPRHPPLRSTFADRTRFRL